MRSRRTYYRTAGFIVCCELAGAVLLAPAARAQSCPPDTTGRSKPWRVAVGLVPDTSQLAPAGAGTEYFMAAEALRARFVTPSGATLPLWAQLSWGPGPTQALGHGLDSRLLFRVNANGRFIDRSFFVKTASPELNIALLAAVLAADSAQELPRPGPDIRKDDGWIRLRLINWDQRDGPAVPLLRMVIPTVEPDTLPRVISIPQPAYPHIAGTTYQPGSLDFAYVVTAQGRVDPASFNLLSGQVKEFADAAMKALGRAKFYPAILKGCRVPILVFQSVSFRGHD